MLNRCLWIALGLAIATSANADDRKYVGGWNGAGANNVHTSIRHLGGDQLEYCFNKQCHGWAVKGSFASKFTFTGKNGEWVFTRKDADTIDGKYTNPQGGVYRSTYKAQ